MAILQLLIFGLFILVPFGYIVAWIIGHYNVPKSLWSQFFVSVIFFGGLGILAYGFTGDQDLATTITAASVVGAFFRIDQMLVARLHAEQQAWDREEELQTEANRKAEVIVRPHYANQDEGHCGQIFDTRC